MNLQLQNIINCNAESRVFIFQINDSYIGQKFDPLFIQFYTLNIFNRLTLIQRSIEPLMKEIELNPNIELPIGILLRSACLDILQYGYVIKCLDEVKIDEKNPSSEIIPDYSNFKSELSKIYSDNLKNNIYDDKALKDVGIISEEEFNERTKLLKTNYHWLLNNEKEFSSSESARRIFKVLKSNKKYDMFSDIFRIYSYYSKLEHFGILSYVLTTSEIYNYKITISRIHFMIWTILNIYGYGLIYLQRDEKDLKIINEMLTKLAKEN